MNRTVKLKVKKMLTSALITFVTTFGVIFLAAVSSESFVWSRTTIIAILSSGIMTAARAVAKVIIESLMGIKDTVTPEEHKEVTG